MQIFFLAALAFALVAVMFALQNIVPVRVTFLTWTFEGSLALVLFVAVIAGAVISVLVSVPSLLRARWTANGLRKQIASLEAELDGVRRGVAAARGPGGWGEAARGDAPAPGGGSLSGIPR